MQSHIVCMGCRSVLLHPRGVTNVCCVICNTISAIPAPESAECQAGMEMAQLVCAGCRTFLVYAHGAVSVRCSCCSTVNLVRTVNQVAQVSCGQCRTTLMFPYGVPSVKCAICQYITYIGMSNMRVPISAHGPSIMTSSPSSLCSSRRPSRVQNRTVVVENPMSLDSSGKLVSKIVIGVMSKK